MSDFCWEEPFGLCGLVFLWLKRIVHSKLKILSSLDHSHVALVLSSVEHKKDVLEKKSQTKSFSYTKKLSLF